MFNFMLCLFLKQSCSVSTFDIHLYKIIQVRLYIRTFSGRDKLGGKRTVLEAAPSTPYNVAVDANGMLPIIMSKGIFSLKDGPFGVKLN